MTHQFYVPIYDAGVTLIRVDKLPDIPEELLPDEDEIDLLKNESVTYVKENDDGSINHIMAFEGTPSYNSIAHESLHCTNSILYSCGIKYTRIHDEVACYLLGWLVEECHKYLD